MKCKTTFWNSNNIHFLKTSSVKVKYKTFVLILVQLLYNRKWVILFLLKVPSDSKKILFRFEMILR